MLAPPVHGGAHACRPRTGFGPSPPTRTFTPSASMGQLFLDPDADRKRAVSPSTRPTRWDCQRACAWCAVSRRATRRALSVSPSALPSRRMATREVVALGLVLVQLGQREVRARGFDRRAARGHRSFERVDRTRQVARLEPQRALEIERAGGQLAAHVGVGRAARQRNRAQDLVAARRHLGKAELIARIFSTVCEEPPHDLAEQRGQRDQVAPVVLDDGQKARAGQQAAKKGEIRGRDGLARDVVDAAKRAALLEFTSRPRRAELYRRAQCAVEVLRQRRRVFGSSRSSCAGAASRALR